MSDKLLELRKQIDELDKELIVVLGKRQTIVKDVGECKKKNSIPPLDSSRWQEVLRSRIDFAKEHNLSEEFIKKVLDIIHDYSLEIEKQ